MTNMIIRTPVGNTENIEFKEVVKQSMIFGPIVYCAETPKVNSIGNYTYTNMVKQIQECQYLWMI